MKKTIFFATLVFALLMAFSFVSARAENSKKSGSPSPSVSPSPMVSASASASPSASASFTPSVIVSISPSASPSPSPSATPTPSPKNQGQTNAQVHRSVVANFVQMLVHVADREVGIGAQVRVIAQGQSQSAGTIAAALEKVENRSKIKTFFIGTDYKNTGVLRSELVQTRNRISQLSRLAEQTIGSDKALLLVEIKSLQDEQTRIENFIKTNESKFSLFGWLVRMFK